jgi:cytochrome P450
MSTRSPTLLCLFPNHLSQRILLIRASFAGSDTVACALRSTIYHLCRNPTIYARVLAEIDTFHKAGQLSDYITYAEALKLDYTVATIKEAMRVHPSAALTYPRYVPKGGTIISGYSFPEGVGLLSPEISLSHLFRDSTG